MDIALAVGVLLLFALNPSCQGLTLEGSRDSYARFPRWYQAFENVLSIELRPITGAGLLLYTDDGGLGNFYELSLSDGHLQLTFRVGGRSSSVHNLYNDQTRVDDGRWHKVVLYHFWETVRMEVDNHAMSITLHQQDFVFSDYEHSSDVFVGGLPADVETSPVRLSYPYAKALPRYQGSIRNLIYRTLPYGVTSPSMLQWQGVRAGDDDYCALDQYCTGEPSACYSMDTGPACNCPPDRSGPRCLTEKTAAEVTLTGSEVFGLDETISLSGIYSRQQVIMLDFKTQKPSGTIFVYGNEKEYVHIALHQGAVTVVSETKGGGQDARVVPFRSDLTEQRLGFSDGQWHSLLFSRTLKMLQANALTAAINLTVDSVFSNVRNTVNEHPLYSTFAFIGGMPTVAKERPFQGRNLSACLRKVRFQADSRTIYMIDELGSRRALSHVLGANLSRSCRDFFSVEPITFFTSADYLNGTAWQGGASSQLSFRFRTKELDGLLLYGGSRSDRQSDFYAVEIFNGHLFLCIDLGSGALRLQIDRGPVNDGQWHTVSVTRTSRNGRAGVDDWIVDFSTPGEARTLEIDSVMYIGGAPWDNGSLSPFVWTATLRRGFIGCLKELNVDGVLLDLLSLLPADPVDRPVEVGCYDMLPQCSDYSCQNDGRCTDGWNSYHCDCSSVLFSGDRCDQEMFSADFPDDAQVLVNFTHSRQTQVNDFRFKFLSEKPDGLLLTTCDRKLDKCFGVQLVGRRLQCFVTVPGEMQIVQWNERLDERQWHTVVIKRRLEALYAEINGRTADMKTFPLLNGRSILRMDFVQLGSALGGRIEQRLNASSDPLLGVERRPAPGFRGSLADVNVDGVALLQLAWHRRADHRILSGRVEFRAQQEYVATFDAGGYAVLRLDNSNSRDSVNHRLQVSFSVKTEQSDAALLYRQGQGRAYMLVELSHGKVVCRFKGAGDDEVTLTSNVSYPLNDMQWHSVSIRMNVPNSLQVVVDDTVTVLTEFGDDSPVVFADNIRIGSLSEGARSRLADKAKDDFRGCLMSVQVNGVVKRLLRDAIAHANIRKGCQLFKPEDCDSTDCVFICLTGGHCPNSSTVAYRFGPRPGGIIFMSTSDVELGPIPDRLVLGLLTYQPDAVVLQLTNTMGSENFELALEGGYCVLTYTDRYSYTRLQESGSKVSDGLYHVIRFERTLLDLSVQVDSADSVMTKMKGQVFVDGTDRPARMVILGGRSAKPVQKQRRSVRALDRAFYGVMSDVLVNQLPLLSLAASGDSRVKFMGDVRRHHFHKGGSDHAKAGGRQSDGVGGANNASTTSTKTTYPTNGIMEDDLFTSGDAASTASTCIEVLDDEDCTADIGNDLITPTLRVDGDRYSTSAPVSQQIIVEATTKSILTTAHKSSSNHVAYISTTKTTTTTAATADLQQTSTMSTTMLTGGSVVPTRWIFPRTSVIAGISLALIVGVVAIIFYVFKCRRDANGSLSSEYKSINEDDAQQQKSCRTALLNGCFGHEPYGHYGMEKSAGLVRSAVKEWYV